MRASDEDRQRVIAALERHTAAGRLSLDEFSERAGVVYAARTLDELRAATVDLPAVEQPHDGRQLLLTFAFAILAVAVIGTAYALFH